MSKGMKWSLVVAIVLVALTVYVLMCCFSSQRQMRNSVVVVQSNVWYSVGTGANKVVYFAQSLHDSTFLAPCTTPKALIETPHFTSGFWANKLALLPTSSGRVVTVIPDVAAYKDTLPSDAITMTQKTLTKLTTQTKQLKREIKETDYYIKVHGVQDEGYNAVATYAQTLRTRLKEAQNVQQRLALLLKEKSLRVLRHTRYTVLVDGKALPTRCLHEDQQWGLCLLQTTDSQTPWHANALSALPWDMSAVGEMRVASVPGLDLTPLSAVKDSAMIWVANVETDGRLRMHTTLGQAGSPVFSSWDRFIGMYNGRGIVPRNIIAQMLWNEK